MIRTDEMIEKRLKARGVDTQSDEGARLLQSEIERSIDRALASRGGILAKLSDQSKRVRVRGITI